MRGLIFLLVLLVVVIGASWLLSRRSAEVPTHVIEVNVPAANGAAH